MKLRHFEDSDTLHIELRSDPASETRDLDENTLIDLDAHGRLVGITIEHATARTELAQLVFERVPA